MRSFASMILASLIFFVSSAFSADPPATPKQTSGIIVLGAKTPASAPPIDSTKVSTAPGRFVPIMAADGSPSYIAKAAGYRVYNVKKGSAYIGVKYDAAPGAEPEEYTWESDVMVLLARNAPGTYPIQLIKNGPGTGPPIDNGAPIDLTVQGALPPPVKPPVVDPVVPPVKPPITVSSFRVILVFESKDTLTAAQNSILYGNVVEDFLNSTCTGGKAGWVRRDKDVPGTYDAAKQAVWNAVKADFAPPKNTKTPAVVIQVNDKITIEPLASSPAAMVATLKAYSEGK